MPAIPSKEMAHFARVWRRGSELFKRAYDEQPLDPETHVHSYLAKKVEDPDATDLIRKCNVPEIVTFINYQATAKEAQKAKFQAIFCLGQAVLDKEEEVRASAQTLLDISRRGKIEPPK